MQPSNNEDQETHNQSRDVGSPINTSQGGDRMKSRGALLSHDGGKINQTTSMSFTGLDLSKEKIDLQEALNAATPLTKEQGSARGSQHGKPPSKSFAADQFVFTHRYGQKRDYSYDDMDLDIPDEIKSLTPMAQRKKLEEMEYEKAGTLNNVRTFFTLMKGFCGTGVVYLAQNFYFGGWGFSAIALFLSYVLTLICSFKLIDSRRKCGKTSFMEIGEAAYGKLGQKLAEISIVCSQVGFVTAYIYFIASQLAEIFYNIWALEISLWWFGLGILFIYTPLCWVRKIEKFSSTHIFADMAIVTTAAVVLIYASFQLADHGVGPDVVFINTNAYLYVIGFAIYTYEGIGVVLPVMDLCEKKESYKTILFLVMTIMMMFFIFFGTMTYLAYGSTMKDIPIILTALPITPNYNLAINCIIKLVFCINLTCTYPLVIYPANVMLESYMFGHMPKSKRRQWSKNLFRALMVAFTITLSLLLGDKLGKFLGLLGAFSCTPVAFTLPTLFHYKLCTNTSLEKGVDIGIMILSMVILVFTSGFALIHWND